MDPKNIAAFDLDGTLLKKNSSFAFCRFLYEKKVLSPSDFYFCIYTYCKHLYFALSLWDLHRLIFERLFYGKEAAQLGPLVEEFIEAKLEELWYFPAIFRLHRLQDNGFESMILSNSPDFLVHPIARKIGIQNVFATEYQSDANGLLSHISLLMDGEKKAEVMSRLGPHKSVAFSDSHLDLSFLNSAHVAVAVNPKYRLKKIALKEGWEIL